MEMSERQKQIVAEAVALMAERGIQYFTMKRLAERIGVTEPALYRHYANKNAILDAVIDSFDTLVQDACVVPPELRGLERLGLLLRQRYRLFAAHPHLAKVMMSETNFQYDEAMSRRVLQVMHGHGAVFAESLTEAQRAGSIPADVPPVHLFHMVVGAVRLLVSRWCLSGFSFDLVVEGEALWLSQKRILER